MRILDASKRVAKEDFVNWIISSIFNDSEVLISRNAVKYVARNDAHVCETSCVRGCLKFTYDTWIFVQQRISTGSSL